MSEVRSAKKYERTKISKTLIDFLQGGIWLLLLIGVFHALYTIWAGYLLLDLPFETTRPESFILNGVRHLLMEIPLYPPTGKEPYIYHVYNPLTYVPSGFIAKHLDLSIKQALMIGRTISFVSTIGVAILLGIWVWMQNREVKPAIFMIASLLFFHSVTFTDYFRLRPESSAIFFTVSGVIVFLFRTKFFISISAFIFFVAFLFKQSFVAAPVSIFIFLLLSGKLRDATRFFIVYGSLIAIFIVLMYFLTGNGYFQHTFLSMAVNDVNPLSTWKLFGPLLIKLFWGPLLILPLALHLVTKDSRYKFLAFYFLISTAWTLYSAGKIGAALNYFSEWAVLVLIVISLSLCVCSIGKHKYLKFFMLAVLVCNVLSVAAFEGVFSDPILIKNQEIVEYVNKYKGMVGTKLITHEAIAIHTGEIVAFDWFLLDQLQEKGVINLDSIYNGIINGKYDILILGKNITSKAENKILQIAQNGPYDLKYEDDMILEFNLIRSVALND